MSELTDVLDVDPPPAAPEKLRLVVLSGPDAGRELLLERGTYLIGKAPGCELELTDAAVSRQHIEVRVGENGVTMRDLESTNGSYYNGARFSEILVTTGAVVQIGQTELRLSRWAGSVGLLPSSADHFGDLIGKSLRMREVYAVLERVAATDTSVFIEGETGTGKELCAEAIHALSTRSKGPFVICDLAGISPNLIESELYGHVRGAFTGADKDRIGAFEQANGGTIFIDEVGELDLAAQPRLLRVLERRQVKPVGAPAYRDVDVRVIAATNRDLMADVRAKTFREDLYHRLAVVRVVLPPLRERKEDITPLAQAFLAARAELSADMLSLLMEYDWPGNVRELRNVVERAVSLAKPGEPINADLLGLESGGPAPAAAEGYKEAKERLISNWEKTFIQDLLSREGGNISRAARRAGIDRVYLHRLIKKHNIAADDL